MTSAAGAAETQRDKTRKADARRALLRAAAAGILTVGLTVALAWALTLVVAEHRRRLENSPRPNVTTTPWPERRKREVRARCMRTWGNTRQYGWLNQCLMPNTKVNHTQIDISQSGKMIFARVG